MINVWIKASERLDDRSDMWVDSVTSGLKDVLQLTHGDEVVHVDPRRWFPRGDSTYEPLLISRHRFELLAEPGNPGRNQAVEVARQRHQRTVEFGEASCDLFFMACADVRVG